MVQLEPSTDSSTELSLGMTLLVIFLSILFLFMFFMVGGVGRGSRHVLPPWPWALDVIIIINIIFSIILLLRSLYIKNPLDMVAVYIGAVGCMYSVTLSTAAAKLISAHQEAGNIIHTLG